MRNSIAAFDWDCGNREKCENHGVSIAEIEFLLSDEPRVAPDPKHSGKEERFIAVGRTENGEAIFVAFTFRLRGEEKFIRPISARYMHEKEVRAYEKKSSEPR